MVEINLKINSYGQGPIPMPIKLSDYHFDLKNKKCVDLLMNKGELWLREKYNELWVKGEI